MLFFVNPVSDKLLNPDWTKMHLAGFNLLLCSSRIAKCCSGEPPEIRMSSKQQTTCTLNPLQKLFHNPLKKAGVLETPNDSHL